jgi:hypothetical protein
VEREGVEAAGKLRDDEVARQTGRTMNAVRLMPTRLNLPTAKGRRKHQAKKQERSICSGNGIADVRAAGPHALMNANGKADNVHPTALRAVSVLVPPRPGRLQPGNCRRRAHVTGPALADAARWPVTVAEDWCGEFEPLIVPEQMADLLARSIVTIGLSRPTVSLLLTEDPFAKPVPTVGDLAHRKRPTRTPDSAALGLPKPGAASAGCGCISPAKSRPRTRKVTSAAGIGTCNPAGGRRTVCKKMKLSGEPGGRRMRCG